MFSYHLCPRGEFLITGVAYLRPPGIEGLVSQGYRNDAHMSRQRTDMIYSHEILKQRNAIFDECRCDTLIKLIILENTSQWLVAAVLPLAQ